MMRNRTERGAMAGRVQVGALGVADVLYRFVVDEALPGSAVDPDVFWAGTDAVIHEFAPLSRELVAGRAELQ
jgi:malate synthase